MGWTAGTGAGLIPGLYGRLFGADAHLAGGRTFIIKAQRQERLSASQVTGTAVIDPDTSGAMGNWRDAMSQHHQKTGTELACRHQPKVKTMSMSRPRQARNRQRRTLRSPRLPDAWLVPEGGLAASAMRRGDLSSGAVTGYRTQKLELIAVYPHRRHLSAKVRTFIDMPSNTSTGFDTRS